MQKKNRTCEICKLTKRYWNFVWRAGEHTNVCYSCRDEQWRNHDVEWLPAADKKIYEKFRQKHPRIQCSNNLRNVSVDNFSVEDILELAKEKNWSFLLATKQLQVVCRSCWRSRRVLIPEPKWE